MQDTLDTLQQVGQPCPHSQDQCSLLHSFLSPHCPKLLLHVLSVLIFKIFKLPSVVVPLSPMQMVRFHYSQIRVKFEGEDGSGPGVNRGLFASLANELKSTNTTKHPMNKVAYISGFVTTAFLGKKCFFFLLLISWYSKLPCSLSF